MKITYKDLVIREAIEQDADQLLRWWNDGSVMEHAGFPFGLQTTVEDIVQQLRQQTSHHQVLIITYQGTSIGEMNYAMNEHMASIGIKICVTSLQNKGLGKTVLSRVIEVLFSDMSCTRIEVDTNLNNVRAQHVYEALGFQQTRISENNWINQVGEPQSTVYYELGKETFQSYE